MDDGKVVDLDNFRPSAEKRTESKTICDLTRSWVSIPNDESQIEVDPTGRHLLLKMFRPSMKGAAEAAQIAQRIEMLFRSNNFEFLHDDMVLKIRLPRRTDVFRQNDRPVLRLAKDVRLEITANELIFSLPGEQSALRTLSWSNLLYRFAWCLEQSDIEHTINESRKGHHLYYACSLRIRLKQ